MMIQAVVGEKGGQEGKWIALLCAVILLVGALLLPYNQAQQKSLTIAQHQVSIKSLTEQPLVIIADLRIAHEEIYPLFKETGSWQSVEQLEQQWIPPFVKDKSWQYRGSHHWTQIAAGVYLGEPVSEGGRFILNSQQAEVDIWLDLSGEGSLSDLLAQDLPISSSLLSSKLIQAGWTQVVFESTQSSTVHPH